MGDEWALGRGGRDQGRPVNSPALEGNHHYHLSPPLWAPLSHRHTHTPLFSFDETIKTTQSYHCGLLPVACDTGRKEGRREGRPVTQGYWNVPRSPADSCKPCLTVMCWGQPARGLGLHGCVAVRSSHAHRGGL